MNTKRRLNLIETSVTRLLVLTKHLLESLTQWAYREVDDKFVSDAYVKLGNDFRAASRAFLNAGINIDDIGDVPQALRVILESALSEPPSQDNLDRFLPNIKSIIVTLLQSLKTKQQRARKDNSERRASDRRNSPEVRQSPLEERQTPPEERRSPPGERQNPPEERESVNTEPAKIAEPTPVVKVPEPKTEHKYGFKDTVSERNALAQLQSESVLLRRASRRFSAYQYLKLANIPSSALPEVPSTPRNLSQSLARSSFVPKESESSSLLYIYLKIDDTTKKVSVKPPVTFASLRLLFVEKFAYSPGIADFPQIYIEDPVTHVSYELEDQYLGDINNGTLLSLKVEKVEPKEEAKEQQPPIDIEAIVARLEKSMESKLNSIVEKVQVAPPVTPPPSLPNSAQEKKPNGDVNKLLNSVEDEVRVIKQLQNANQSLVQDYVELTNKKVRELQSSTIVTNTNSNRSYMEECHNKLSQESDSLLTQVDDLQDLMELLRKDVAQRGVRVSAQQLKQTMKEINDAKESLAKMTKYIETEKGVWKKIWEAELDKVCEEQQFFNLQDDLTKDLDEDLAKIKETFELIEQCSAEQSKQPILKRINLRIPEPGENLHDIKDAVLNEVAALKPDHESRVEAINRAERLREKNRQLMGLTEFQEELGSFVDDARLKRSGGVDEIERLRKQKDEENLRSMGVI